MSVMMYCLSQQNTTNDITTNTTDAHQHDHIEWSLSVYACEILPNLSLPFKFHNKKRLWKKFLIKDIITVITKFCVQTSGNKLSTLKNSKGAKYSRKFLWNHHCQEILCNIQLENCSFLKIHHQRFGQGEASAEYLRRCRSGADPRSWIQ
jgi:hypothetical protein